MKAGVADGYIRVSRRGGREGDSFISPDVQRERIAKWAQANDVEIVQWWEEIDQSGARLERPMFQEALARCERGETGGIVVAKLDRFARSAVDALDSIRRLNAVDARLVSVEDGFDGSTPMGRFAIGILAMIAELELERIKENWATAITRAVDRGIHISSRPPTGYARDENKRLVAVEPAASAVKEVFRRRALGASWAGLADYLEERGVETPRGNAHWSKTGVSGLVKNPAYLGQARGGSVVNDDAHEALVTRAEFDAAQSVTKSLLKTRDGSLAEKAMLGGLTRCFGCGHTLKITGNTDRRTAERYPIYYCTGRYSSGPCPSRASVRSSLLDAYVEEQVLEALQQEDGLLAQAVDASHALEEATRALADAEHELDLFVKNPKLLTTIGETLFVEGVEARQHVIDEARDTVVQLRTQSTLADELGDGDLLRAWPTLTIQQKRRLLHGLLDRVVVSRARGRGKNANPVGERAQVVLRGNVLLGANPDGSARSGSG
jgi:site-specific DNA recombinase